MTNLIRLLDKLLKGVEVPEPEYLNVQLTTDHEHGYAPIVRHIDAYSADQLLKYGAAQRLAGREQAIEEAMRVTLAYQLGELEDTDDWPNLIAAAIEQLKGQP